MGAETSFTDVVSGARLAQNFAFYRIFQGIAYLWAGPLGARIHGRFGNAITMFAACSMQVVGALGIALFYKETQGFLFALKKDEKKRMEKKKKGGGPSNPLAFVKLFKDGTLARLTVINTLHTLSDYTFQLDDIYLRQHVGLDNASMGWFGMVRGVSYIVGGTFARTVQPKMGPWAYTQMIHAILVIYLVLKANARSLATTVAYLAFYTLGPFGIRSSATQALLFERGVALGHTREALVAANANLGDWLKIVGPFVYLKLFNGLQRKGNLYYFCAIQVAIAQLLFMTIDRSGFASSSKGPAAAAAVAPVGGTVPLPSAAAVAAAAQGQQLPGAAATPAVSDAAVSAEAAAKAALAAAEAAQAAAEAAAAAAEAADFLAPRSSGRGGRRRPFRTPRGTRTPHGTPGAVAAAQSAAADSH